MILTFYLHLYPMCPAVDVLHGVIVVDERGARVRPIEHSLPRTCLKKTHTCMMVKIA